MGKKCTIQYRYVNASELNDGFRVRTLESAYRLHPQIRAKSTVAVEAVADLGGQLHIGVGQV